jgi:hypothetical protein
MKALRFAEFGSPSVLRIEEVPIPEPGEGEALVRVKAAAINPSDIGNVAGRYQWGSFGSASIRAWSVSTETGFTFDRIRFHPRPLLRADVYSGDGNPATQPLGTFNLLFPRGAYFTPKVFPFLGPQNLIDLHPVVRFQLKSNVTGAFAWDWYWRESTHDGIYAFGSDALIDPASASHARYLGNQGDLEIRWAPVRHIILAFNFAGFVPGTFFNTVTYNAAPVAANVGFTFRF